MFKSVSVFSQILLSLMLVLGLSGCRTNKEVRIGFIAQLTGPDSFIGQTSKLALDDRIKAINRQGGIHGYRVRLVTYDSGFEIPKAVAAAKRLATHDNVVAVIGPEWSGAAIPVAEIADIHQVPIIATAATNDNVTVDPITGLHPYMFRVCFIDSYQGQVLASYAYKVLEKQNAAFVTDVTSAYSVGVQEFFTRQFESLGGKVVIKTGYRSGDTNFTQQITSIQYSDADFVVIPSVTYRDPVNFAREANARGINLDLLGTDGWVADDLLESGGKYLEGSYLSSGLTTDQPKYQQYNQDYFDAHKRYPSTYSYYALDALQALEYAIGVSINQNGKPDREAVRQTLEHMDEVPVFTGMLSIDPATHNPVDAPILIMQIQDNRFEVVTSYQP